MLIAEAGNAIIVGRAGAILTRHLKNCYHFRLDASDAFCVSSTARRLKLSEKEAAEMMRQYDQKREAFIERHLRASIGDLTHYHAVYNRDRSGLEEIASGIAPFVERGWEHGTCFKSGIPAAVAA